jgi:hypothetical protein
VGGKCWHRIFNTTEHTNKNIWEYFFDFLVRKGQIKNHHERYMTKELHTNKTSLLLTQTYEYPAVCSYRSFLYSNGGAMQLFTQSERGITSQSQANVQLNKTHAVRVHASRGCEDSKVFNNSPHHSAHRVGNLPVSN